MPDEKTLQPVQPVAGLAGFPPISIQQEQPAPPPAVEGPATEGPANPGQSIARHIMAALGGSNGQPMDWAKGILAGGLAGAANVGKVPEGAGWLAGASRGVLGAQEFQRQKMMDQQRLQQQQFENNLRTQQNARAEKELSLSADRTKAEISLHNVQELAAIHADQQNQLMRPYLLGEAADKFDAAEAAKEAGIMALKKELIKAGVKPEELDKAYNYQTAPSGAAMQMGNSDLMVLRNGERAAIGEDNVGAHAISSPAALMHGTLKENEKILTGYEYNPKTKAFVPKYTEMAAGTPYSTVIATHDAAMDYLAQQQKQLIDQVNLQKNIAETGKIGAETSEAQAKTRLTNKQIEQMGAGDLTKSGEEYLASLPATERDVVQAIGTGKMIPDRLGYLLSKNEKLAAEVMHAYPEFDLSKAKAYQDVYKEFTSSRRNTAGGSLNAGGTALKHLRDLKAINDADPLAARVPGTAANKAYNNLMDTVAGELAQFYNLPQTNESINSMKNTLGGTFNRDSAIVRQAQSMAEKLDSYEQTWKNAAPSPHYQAPVPWIDDEAKKARAELDPRYAERLRTEGTGTATTAAPTMQPIFASAPGKPRLMSTDGGKTWAPAPSQ